MNKYDPQAVPVKTKPLPYQEVDGEVFAITPDDGMLHNLNEVGSIIWNLIDGKTNIGDIENKILSQYEIDSPTLQADLLSFMNKITEKGLIEYKK
jgi:hypothetical protein